MVKALLLGLVLEPAHRQGELERTVERKRGDQQEQTALQNFTLKWRLVLPHYRCLCVCPHSYTSLVADGVVEWRIHTNTHWNEMLMMQALSLSSIWAAFIVCPSEKNHQSIEGAVCSSFKLCHYVATHLSQWRRMSQCWLWKSISTHLHIFPYDAIVPVRGQSGASCGPVGRLGCIQDQWNSIT